MTLVISPEAGFGEYFSVTFVMTCQHHGQVRQTPGGLILAGGRRHDEHHRVIVNIAAGFRSDPTDGHSRTIRRDPGAQVPACAT
jgi:hypothetical protein